jgi:hypothetical protein
MRDERRGSQVGLAGWIALAILAGLLVVSIGYAIRAWTSMSGVQMSTLGWTFLVLAVLVTFGLGAGLMALVFYSSRHDLDR